MAKDKPGYILTKDTAKMAKLAKQWLKLSPTKRSEFREKNSLQSLISKARGSIIFGALNDAERSTNNIVAGLDEKGKLIFVFGKPAKIYDPASFMNKIVKKEDFEANEDDFELQEAFKSPSRVDKARKVGVATGYDNEGDVGPYEVWIEPNKKYGGDSIYFKPKKGSETPRWDLNDILYGNKAFSTKPIADTLLIDFGQGWGVKGLDPVLKKLRKEFAPTNEDLEVEVVEHDTSELIGYNLEDQRLHAKIRACVESSVTDDQLDHLVEDFGLNEHSSNRDIIVAATALLV